MAAVEQSDPPAQDPQQEKKESQKNLEKASCEQPGPSQPTRRQGFCSCCQVLYNSVEQHVLSSRHREVLRGPRAQVPAGSLMERFLKDVLQHHPHHYNDTRPTHADLPCLSSPLVPREELSDVCISDGDTVGTREELPSSDDESCQLVQIQEVGSSPRRSKTSSSPRRVQRSGSGTDSNLALITRSQTEPEKVKRGIETPPKDRHSPRHGFLHRSSDDFTSIPPRQPYTSQATPPVHRKAHRKTNRRRHQSDSGSLSSCSPVTRGFSSKAPPPWIGATREKPSSSSPCDSVEQVIEEVIKRCCHPHSPKTNQHSDEESIHLNTQTLLPTHKYTRKHTSVEESTPAEVHTPAEVSTPAEVDIPEILLEEEGSFHISLCSMGTSAASEQWDTPVQVEQDACMVPTKDLTRLMKAQVHLQDQRYKSQLDTALNQPPSVERGEGTREGLQRSVTPERREQQSSVEEVLQALPHIPRSFVGKTLTQVMYEDDLKIQSLVREFRQGRFRCYFDSESLARFGRRSKKEKKRSVCEFVQLFDHDGDDPECHRVLPRRRAYRLASRCQVVRVSHGTQTTQVSDPVVRRRPPEKPGPAQEHTGPPPPVERTPDRSTRLSTLPASYSRIISPVQHKSMVYVLASLHEPPPRSAPPRASGRKRKSCDSDGALKYKYKKSPLKYYDPLTNRIQKTPPKGATKPPHPKLLPHVRQLFRSLSPDINREKQGVESSRDAWSSIKGRASSSVTDICASTLGSGLEPMGPSDRGSACSSQRALFSRSSLSGSSCFLLGARTPAHSHTDSASRALTSDPEVSRVQTRSSRRERSMCMEQLIPEKGHAHPAKPKREQAEPPTNRHRPLHQDLSRRPKPRRGPSRQAVESRKTCSSKDPGQTSPRTQPMPEPEGILTRSATKHPQEARTSQRQRKGKR